MDDTFYDVIGFTPLVADHPIPVMMGRTLTVPQCTLLKGPSSNPTLGANPNPNPKGEEGGGGGGGGGGVARFSFHHLCRSDVFVADYEVGGGGGGRSSSSSSSGRRKSVM